jgi:UDP-glucose 4-epimerase
VKITIVGASGNVGTALLRALERDGPHEVVGIARRLPPDDAPYRGVDWHAIDISRPEAAGRLTTAFEGTDHVVNLAWAFQPGRDVEYLQAVGVGGLEAVLEAARAAGAPHLVHMSSVGAYSKSQRGVAVDEQWPTAGVASSPYSIQKAEAERILDRSESSGEGPACCRLRPGLIMQRDAGSGLLRYGVPGWLPRAALDLVPLLPLDRSFAVPVVHTRDVATAIVSALHARATGAFNLAARSPLTPPIIAEVLRASTVHVPWQLLRAAVAAGWQLHLERLDPGWIDLAFSVPLLDCGRAARELDWTPVLDAPAVLREAVTGMRDGLSTTSAPMRRRSVLDELATSVRDGSITRRRFP